MSRMIRFLPLLLLTLVVSCKRPEYTSGEAVFQGECVKCHRMHGKGGKKGPELTEVFNKRDEQYVRTYVTNPRFLKADGTMPPAKISDHEMDLIVQYLKEQAGSH